jgi:geranylgeranyl reductase family protein
VSTAHVLIVGAGPAGSAAATFLARQGIRVTLLERHRFPRDKVCGDGLTPRSLWMLDRLGLNNLCVERGAPIHRVYLASPGGHTLIAPLPAHIFGGRAGVVTRELLDEALVRHAQAAGAELVEQAVVEKVHISAQGAKVRLADGREFSGDIVLGCDGAPSVVRQALGAPSFPDEHSAFAVRVYYENLQLTHPDAYAIFWEQELLPAYGWVFPLPGGRANVGIGLRTDHMRARNEKLPALLEQFCSMPRAREQLKGGTRIGRAKGHHLPMGAFVAPIAFDRALLLGDAAGFINPLTGEGIEFAMESGEIASEVIAECVRHGDFSLAQTRVYQQRCRARFQKTFDINHKMQRFFSAPRLVDRVFRAANRSERVTHELADVLLGEDPKITWRLAVALATGW